MFCGKCGTENADGAKFCCSCGEQLEAAMNDNSSSAMNSATADTNAASQTISNASANSSSNNNDILSKIKNIKMDNRTIGIIATAVIALVVICIGIAIFGGRSYKKTVKMFCESYIEADGEKMLKVFPDELIDKMLEEEGYKKSEVNKLEDELTENLESISKSMTMMLGDDYKLTYEIGEVEDVDKDELEEIQDKYKELDIKVKKAKTVEVIFNIEYEGEEKEALDNEINVIKIGNSWYISFEDAGSFL